jgi:protein-S-isoprenylcysteine O-methyltransferase Ste14
MNPLFPSDFEMILFAALILLWISIDIISVLIIEKLRRSGGALKKKDNAKGSTILLRASLYVSIVLAFLLSENKITLLPDWLFYPGVLLMVLGLLVRQGAIIVLGRSFTQTISVQKNQKVVDHGPYRYIRHPSYLGLFMIVIGIGVALQTWGGILVIIVLFGLAVGYRIHIEEKFLVLELGDEYIKYMKKTKRLIPFIF